MNTPASNQVYFLLVDDLEENLMALEALLRRKDLVLLKARSGTEALELLLQYDIALALIDVQMPGMDGFELAELMRGTMRTNRVPIIFLTAGSADRQRRFRGYEAGAVDFLHKPLEPDILRSKADVFFQLYRQRQEVAQHRDELKAATDENVRLLNESRSQAAALREAAQRKDEFLAMLAHELRNPLAPIQNAAELLRLIGPNLPEVEQSREIISRQVGHMSRLIDDLLDVARIARGTVQLCSEQCDLAGIVRQTAEDYRSVLSAAGLTLRLEIPSEPLPVVGDRVRLAQVLGNLLHNASKFTPAGGRVTVSVTPDSAAHTAIVTVQDSGIGFDSTQLKLLFEPFAQANQTIDRAKGGLGLGLALVKGLIELHGGSVSASSPGIHQGATFILQLPLLKQQTANHSPSPTSAGPTATQKLRIMVVEDNPDAAESLRMLLKVLGHEVEVAYDGQSALEVGQATQPQVVISDLGLPGEIDGYELARKIRENPVFQNPLLIALSGYGQEEDRQRTQAAGFDQHLVKPVNLDRLRKVLTA